MKIYHVDRKYSAIMEGIDNHTYRITGRNNFRIWVNKYAKAILLKVSANVAESLCKGKKGGVVAIKSGEIDEAENRIVLNATRDEHAGAIVFWDFSDTIVSVAGSGSSSSWRIYNVGYPVSINAKNAKVLQEDRGRFKRTLLCIIYDGGMIEAVYHSSKKVRVRLDGNILNFKILM